MPAHLGRDAFIQRVALRGPQTYREIRTFWDINEVARANEHFDIQDDVEWLQSEDLRRKMKADS